MYQIDTRNKFTKNSTRRGTISFSDKGRAEVIRKSIGKNNKAKTDTLSVSNRLKSYRKLKDLDQLTSG